jgi:hypothetical protein
MVAGVILFKLTRGPNGSVGATSSNLGPDLRVLVVRVLTLRILTQTVLARRVLVLVWGVRTSRWRPSVSTIFTERVDYL